MPGRFRFNHTTSPAIREYPPWQGLWLIRKLNTITNLLWAMICIIQISGIISRLTLILPLNAKLIHSYFKETKCDQRFKNSRS